MAKVRDDLVLPINNLHFRMSGCPGYMKYNELFQKTRFPSVPIAALCLYEILRENLVSKNSTENAETRTSGSLKVILDYWSQEL